MLKSVNSGVLWLNLVCQEGWCSGRPPKDWQTGVITPIHKQLDRQERMQQLPVHLTPQRDRLLPGRVEPRPNWSKSAWNDCHKEQNTNSIDHRNSYRSGDFLAVKQSQISHRISAMMRYEL